jgi:hypothetical protein
LNRGKQEVSVQLFEIVHHKPVLYPVGSMQWLSACRPIEARDFSYCKKISCLIKINFHPAKLYQFEDSEMV